MKKTTLIIALAICCATQMMAQLNGSGYYRLRNSYHPTHYISFANHVFDYTPIIDTAAGGAENLSSSTEAQNLALACAGVYLQTDIHMVEESEGYVTPSTLIYLKNNSGNEYNLIAEGTSLIALTTGQRTTGNVKPSFKNRYAMITKKDGSGTNTRYTASIELKGTYLFTSYSLGTRYFVDNDGIFNIEEQSNNDNGYWYIEPVSSFKINAVYQHDGKYYATLYVPFAFTLGNDVLNAYVVSDIDVDNQQVTMLSIKTTGGKVPAGTPVVLECTSNTPSLIPSGEPLTCSAVSSTSYAPDPNVTSKYSNTNYLSGTYYCNTDGLNANGVDKGLTFSRYTTTAKGRIYASDVTINENENMRVLAAVGNRIGFFKYSGKYMGANKAWLQLPATAATASMMPSAFKINFDGVADLPEEDQVVSEDGGFLDGIDGVQMNDRHGVVYDLQGRRISSESITKGIYIINGKKVLIQ